MSRYIRWTDQSVYGMIRSSTTREAIIKAAIELFSEQSYSKSSIEDIALRAGVSKGAIFHYFNSKIDLAEAVMKNILATIEQKVDQILSSSDEDKEKIRQLVDLTIQYAQMNTDKPSSLEFVSEICRALAENNRYDFIKESYEKIRNKIASILRHAGIARSEIRATLFMITLNGLIHYTFFYPRPLEKKFADELKEEAVQVMFS
ncbi:MAG: TetR/AcrR family transcriptional regulator [Nitrososphaerota archaeon]